MFFFKIAKTPSLPTIQRGRLNFASSNGGAFQLIGVELQGILQRDKDVIERHCVSHPVIYTGLGRVTPFFLVNIVCPAIHQPSILVFRRFVAHITPALGSILGEGKSGEPIRSGRSAHKPALVLIGYLLQLVIKRCIDLALSFTQHPASHRPFLAPAFVQWPQLQRIRSTEARIHRPAEVMIDAPPLHPSYASL